MRQNVRAADVVARLGGDEFAILQHSEPNQRSGAMALAARLVDVIGAPYDIEGSRAVIGASIGIAIAPEHGESVSELLRSADLALYRVKADGRNGFRVYDEALDRAQRDRLALESELRDAIAAGDLQLHYQPVVALAGRRVCTMEAQVRWPHPRHGMLEAGDIIPLAEEAGLIVALGEWAILRACLDAASWPERVQVSVDVSPIHVRNGTAVDTIRRALPTAHLAPKRLAVQISETAMLQHHEALMPYLHQLRALGVSVALDDFGSGYFSLGCLQMFSFDDIRLARSFVSEIATRPESAAILCAASGLARSLDVLMTADGVETGEQLRLLSAAGCTRAQGQLFGTPRRAADVSFTPTIVGLRRSSA